MRRATTYCRTPWSGWSAAWPPPAVSRLSDDDLVLGLIRRWGDLHRQGSPTTPEKLCADGPELRAAVRDGVRALRAVDPYLATLAVAPARPGRSTAGAGDVP